MITFNFAFIITIQLHKKIVALLKCEMSKIWQVFDLCSLFPLFNTLGMSEETCADNYSTKYKQFLKNFIPISGVFKLGQKCCIDCQQCKITYKQSPPLTSC